MSERAMARGSPRPMFEGGQTDTYENITFPHMCWRVVIKITQAAGILLRAPTNYPPPKKKKGWQLTDLSENR